MSLSKNTLIYLAAGLLIGAVSCGTDADPSKNNSANNTSENNTSTNNTSTNNTSTNNTSTNNTSTNNTSTNNTSTNNTSTNNNNPVDCTILENFYGQIAGADANGGGVPTMDGLDFDANLAAVLAAVPTTADNPETMEVDEGRADGLDIQVTGALVIATHANTANFASGNVRFYLQDMNSAIKVYLDQGEMQPLLMKVGNKVSFKATSVRNFGGVPQIAKISDLTIDSEGNAVPYSEATGTDITMDDYDRNVRVWGTITGGGDGCGGQSKCYTLSHGDKTITLRSASTFLAVGQCVTYVGPASSFPGPLGTGAKTVQLDQINFNWLNEKR
jgi:hypothetical protein